MATDTPALSAYQRRLLGFLSVATFFEGFDFLALAQILPNLRAAMDLSPRQGGVLLAVINCGMVLSYLLVRKADTWGRRRVLSVSRSMHRAARPSRPGGSLAAPPGKTRLRVTAGIWWRSTR